MIVGRVGGEGGQAAFAIAIDDNGHVATAEWLSLHQDSADSNGDIDEAVHLKGGLVSATVTITDGDGDTASASADISHDIQFEDDGPTIIGTALGEPKLTVDESFIPIGSQQPPPGSNVASADFSHQFFVNAGVDGEKSLTYALTLNNAATGLIDSLTGTAVTLHSVDATHIQALDGNNDMVFTLTVDSGGVVTLTDLRGVHEDALSNTPNDSITLPAGLVSLSATVTDGDGDQASASVDLGHAITIKDDGPYIISEIASGTVAQDETPGVQTSADPNAQNDVAGADLPTGVLKFVHACRQSRRRSGRQSRLAGQRRARLCHQLVADRAGQRRFRRRWPGTFKFGGVVACDQRRQRCRFRPANNGRSQNLPVRRERTDRRPLRR